MTDNWRKPSRAARCMLLLWAPSCVPGARFQPPPTPELSWGTTAGYAEPALAVLGRIPFRCRRCRKPCLRRRWGHGRCYNAQMGKALRSPGCSAGVGPWHQEDSEQQQGSAASPSPPPPPTCSAMPRTSYVNRFAACPMCAPMCYTIQIPMAPKVFNGLGIRAPPHSQFGCSPLEPWFLLVFLYPAVYVHYVILFCVA